MRARACFETRLHRRSCVRWQENVRTCLYRIPPCWQYPLACKVRTVLRHGVSLVRKICRQRTSVHNFEIVDEYLPGGTLVGCGLIAGIGPPHILHLAKVAVPASLLRFDLDSAGIGSALAHLTRKRSSRVVDGFR